METSKRLGWNLKKKKKKKAEIFLSSFLALPVFSIFVPVAMLSKV